MNGTEDNDSLCELFRQAMPDDLPAPIEQRLEQRLMAFREQLDAESAVAGSSRIRRLFRPGTVDRAADGGSLEPARPRNRLAHLMGELTMRQRIALGGVGAAVLIVLLVVWGGIIALPVSAMEKMAENLRKAKSYTVTTIMQVQLASDPGKPPVMAEMTQKAYWLAPKSYRMEFKGGSLIEGQDVTDILPSGKAGIHLDNKTKKFRRQTPRLGPEAPLMMLDKLSAYSGQADRKLETKSIHGKKAWGFEIDGKKIDPDALPGPVEIWVDAESNLPVALRYEAKWPGMSMTTIIRMEDFRWNIELDPKLFDPTPPEGYVDDTGKETPLDEKVRQITEALRTYAEASGGHYPRVKIVYGDVTHDELVRMLGVAWPPSTTEQMRDEKVAKIRQAAEGFAQINGTQRDNPDAAYYGKTVGPSDKDKVLFRWKLDDGRYEVIFGNLRSETVTAERLHDVEGK